LFGHSPSLVCPHGYNRNVDEKTEERISGAYGKRLAVEFRMLHEAAYSLEELLADAKKGGANRDE
jgi:hypothetical protein